MSSGISSSALDLGLGGDQQRRHRRAEPLVAQRQQQVLHERVDRRAADDALARQLRVGHGEVLRRTPTTRCSGTSSQPLRVVVGARAMRKQARVHARRDPQPAAPLLRSARCRRASAAGTGRAARGASADPERRSRASPGGCRRWARSAPARARARAPRAGPGPALKRRIVGAQRITSWSSMSGPQATRTRSGEGRARARRPRSRMARSCVTTLLAPITQRSPMLTPLVTTTFAPSQQLSPMRVGPLL